MSTSYSVELLPHDSAWAEQAGHEAARLHLALGSILLRVHHVGSTAIPQIVAKPILDLIPEFTSLAALDAARATMESLGYDWRGEYGLPDRRYCTLSDPQPGQRRIHAHCYASGSAEIARHLAFRDYLCAHPQIAQAYAAEKQRCRTLNPHDSGAYSAAKHAWIQPVQATALAWFRSQESAER